MNALRISLGLVLAFLALNAFGGGVYGMSGAEAVPVEWLVGSPFTSYFIPSLILFAVVGGMLAYASIAVFRNKQDAPLIALAAACVVLGWMVAQLAIVGFVSFNQPAVVALCLVILLLASIWQPARGQTPQPAAGESTQTAGRLRRIAPL